VPQIMLHGFLGFAPRGDGFKLDPRLPSSCPELQIDRIQLHDVVLKIRATPKTIELWKEGVTEEPCSVYLPAGQWTWTLTHGGKPVGAPVLQMCTSNQPVVVNWAGATGARFERGAKPN
jgi:hypothetical protein